MMNQVSIMGRLVADPKLQTFQKDGKENAMAMYRLASERDYKKDNVRPVDFIACKAFDTEARFAKEYFHQGDLVIVMGRIVAEPYKKEGEEKDRIFTCVQVKNCYFCRRRGDEQTRNRVMSPMQDGKTQAENGMIGVDYADLPPLPEDDIYGQIAIETDLSFG